MSNIELRDLSLDAKLRMDLNFNICQPETNEKKHSTDDLGIKSTHVINLGENAHAIGSSEHVCLPTVFEGKITHERKVLQKEKLTNMGKLSLLCNSSVEK